MGTFLRDSVKALCLYRRVSFLASDKCVRIVFLVLVHAFDNVLMMYDIVAILALLIGT